MSANILTIPPGAPFLATFARALVRGKIIPGLAASDPLSLARTTIYVPTRRAARALRQELAAAMDAPAMLLPRIRPLGGLDGAEGMFGGGDPLAMPAPIGDIARRMILAQLVLQWGQALQHAIISIGPDGAPQTDPTQPLMVANHFAGAWHLAGDLAGLIDELIIEAVEWQKLDDLGGSFDEYWRITLNFLDIAITSWPDILFGRGQIDPARHQVRMVEAQITALANATDKNPIIAIGSTGTNAATARLLAAIARAPRGAVVLPGLDQILDAASFAQIGSTADDRADPATGHPQAALRRLLGVLGVARDDVRALGDISSALAARARFVSQALRPADTTELWGTYRQESAAEIPAALAGVTLIEAGDEREEALALAIAMRHVLEDPDATAALVTPNRDLAARVRAELLRWGIVVDDSGGEPLGTTPHGALARLVLACVESHHGAMDVVALLAHPLVQLGQPRAEIARLAGLVEIGVLRVALPEGEVADVVADAQLRAARKYAHPAQKRIADADWVTIEALLNALNTALVPLDTLPPDAPARAWLAAHRAALVALCAVPDGETFVAGADREVLGDLFDELDAATPPAITLSCSGYASFFSALTMETIVRGPQHAHPRVKILGLLEARLIRADVMLLGGLDETVWPPQAQTDAFLNRSMRARLGLSPPERRIGQTAHDFEQAMGCERVILSRAVKRGGSPMVTSRFLQRMAALAGAEWAACQARGTEWLHLAGMIDEPRVPHLILRPAPKPPVALRPTKLSVTQIETLRRDPYSIFAKEILGLVPLDKLGQELGAREMGEYLHAALAQFCAMHPSGALPTGALVELEELTWTMMLDLLGNAAFRAFQWPRILKALDFYVKFEGFRRGLTAQIKPEQHGRLVLALDDGSIFTLTGIADRLEIAADGSVTIVDFKTGKVPSMKEVRAGFAPQLTLEAMMVDNGAFHLPEGSVASGALYVKLINGDDGGKPHPLHWKEKVFGEVVADHYQELMVLLNQFRDVETPYPSRPYVQFLARFSDYDHLARVKEWSAQAGEDGV